MLNWLPESPDWRSRLKVLRAGGVAPEDAWAEAVALANCRIDFVATNALDQTVRSLFGSAPSFLAAKPVRLALLGTATMAHLHAGLRVAGLRRGLWVEIYENDFGQYMQELWDENSGLRAFAPTHVLFALDARHLAAEVGGQASSAETDARLESSLDQISGCWRRAQTLFQAQVLHQTALPVLPNLLGSNEHRLAGSPAQFLARLNWALQAKSDACGVDLLRMDAMVARHGVDFWHNAEMWGHAKQEIALPAAPFYGDLVVRLIAARRGLSAKGLVLDLDNTLWGGVIGDDGLDGIVLGQGSALGEAYAAFQHYARGLSSRGVILAVCSKNDEANAIEPFDKHPDMVLRRADIACFVADWNDKAGNIKRIAAELNIGVDSLVFIDDNPVERALVRRELPEVRVPEVSDDPLGFIRAIEDAGYFESVAVTAEDRERSRQYQGNRAREALKASATDLDSYLQSLDMELIWSRFDRVGLQRVVQLINKTNQFNLTTRRYSEDSVTALMADDKAFGLQLRLIDKFGDNGVIAIVIGKKQDDGSVDLDTWLMSCRVLGRQVEAATLNLVVEQAKGLGGVSLIGTYRPTAKNAMVRDHYARLGFALLQDSAEERRFRLELNDYAQVTTFIKISEG